MYVELHSKKSELKIAQRTPEMLDLLCGRRLNILQPLKAERHGKLGSWYLDMILGNDSLSTRQQNAHSSSLPLCTLSPSLASVASHGPVERVRWNDNATAFLHV